MKKVNLSPFIEKFSQSAVPSEFLPHKFFLSHATWIFHFGISGSVVFESFYLFSEGSFDAKEHSRNVSFSSVLPFNSFPL